MDRKRSETCRSDF